MLWLGLMSRDTGVPASEHLKIKDEVVALDFNRAVTLRLLSYDNDVAKNQAKRIAYEVGRMLTGAPEEEGLNELVENDPYADANTQIM